LSLLVLTVEDYQDLLVNADTNSELIPDEDAEDVQNDTSGPILQQKSTGVITRGMKKRSGGNGNGGETKHPIMNWNAIEDELAYQEKLNVLQKWESIYFGYKYLDEENLNSNIV
jgi:hypothetical protein